MSVDVDAPGTAGEQPAIPLGAAAGAWAAGWLLGSGVLAVAVLALVSADVDDLTIPELALVSVVGWSAFLVALWYASRHHGTGRFVADYALTFRPVDLVGVPLGVATQLLLVPALYVPLQWRWPDTFTDERLEERAQDLADRADGSAAILLVLVVVVGAPIVEELVYRGLLQRSLARSITAWPALGFAALWFSLIHLAPVEYPGLFLAGLVFGAGVVVTGRLGPAIVTHAAFNACGIAVVLANR